MHSTQHKKSRNLESYHHFLLFVFNGNETYLSFPFYLFCLSNENYTDENMF